MVNQNRINMKSKITLFLVAIFAFVSAQSDSEAKNILKTNLTGISLKNYSLQYERILSQKTSIAIQFRYMPEGSLPMTSTFESFGDENSDDIEMIENIQVGNFAITPEFRWYLGRGNGHGFYIAPFYRYAKFTVGNTRFDFTNDFNIEESATLSGDISSHSGGILLGSQWLIGKHFVIDFWIIGPHYGVSNGDFEAITSRVLSSNEQQELKSELENFEIPFFETEVTSKSNGADIKVDGAWAGIRSGLSVGFYF